MQAIALTGLKKSGKTTIGVELVQELKRRGLSVAVVKSTKHHFDKAGTDTSRYREAGVPVVGISGDESFISWPRTRGMPELIPLAKADFLVVEGGKELGFLPRVLFLSGEETGPVLDDLRPELAVAAYGSAGNSGLPVVDSVPALADLALDKGFMLAALDCGGCGREDCAGLAADIVAGDGEPGDCVALNTSCKVVAGGTEIALNPYVEKTFIGVIKGLMAPLKGIPAGPVTITLDLGD